MKIVILHRSYYPNYGGVENSIYYVSKELHGRGIETTIITQRVSNEPLNGETPYAKLLKYKKYKTPKLLLPFATSIYYKRTYKQIKDLLINEAPDAVIARDSLLAKAAMKIIPGVHITYIPPGVFEYYNKGIRPSKGFINHIKEILRYIQLKTETKIQNEIFKNCNKLIVFSKNVMDQVDGAVGYTIEDAVIAYPGVSEKFSFSPACNDEILEEFSIPKDKKILLYIGRVVQEKNVIMLIKAFAASQNEDTRLVIVGEGDAMKDAKELSVNLGVEGKITFAGHRKDTERFYKSASVTILPSYYEALGQVIIESLSSGTPVIGFKSKPPKVLTAVDEMIEDNITGFICEDYGQEYLKDAIDKAVDFCKNNNEQYINMRSNCHESAKRRFSWSAFTDTILNNIKG